MAEIEYQDWVKVVVDTEVPAPSWVKVPDSLIVVKAGCVGKAGVPWWDGSAVPVSFDDVLLDQTLYVDMPTANLERLSNAEQKRRNRDEAIELLRGQFEPGDTVYLIHTWDKYIYCVLAGHYRCDDLVSKALGIRQVRGGVVYPGGGEQLVYALGRLLYDDYQTFRYHLISI